MTWPTAAFTAFISSSSTADASGRYRSQDRNRGGVRRELRSPNCYCQYERPDSGTDWRCFWLVAYQSCICCYGWTGGTAAGTLYIANSGVTSGVPTGTTYARLQTVNQTQMAVYTVPAGHTLYLDDLVFTAAISQANNYATVSLIRETLAQTFQDKVSLTYCKATTSD